MNTTSTSVSLQHCARHALGAALPGPGARGAAALSATRPCARPAQASATPTAPHAPTRKPRRIVPQACNAQQVQCSLALAAAVRIQTLTDTAW